MIATKSRKAGWLVGILLVVLLLSQSISGQVTGPFCAPRTAVFIEHEIEPSDPRIGDLVLVKARVKTIEGENSVAFGEIQIKFEPPYENFTLPPQRVLGPIWNPSSFLIRAERAHISFDYVGPDEGACELQYQNAIGGTSVSPQHYGTIYWMSEHFVAILAIFFVIMAYRWFSPNRLDIEMILQESGILSIIQDFFGARKR
ncbi:hypothetical protein ACFLRC_01755 [Candidatus Altiarchaeota archaeon]